MIQDYQLDALPLAPRLIYILKQRRDGKTLSDIGVSMDMTRERIRQLQAVALSQIQDREFAAELLAEIHYRKSARAEYMALRRTKAQVHAAIKAVGFDREAILRAAEVDQDPAFTSLGDVELCDWLHDTFRVTRFGEAFIYCQVCHAPKPPGAFSAATASNERLCRICRECGRKRQNRYYHKNSKKLIAQARAMKNKAAIYQKRSHLRKEGKLDEMPPLPPRGIKGDVSLAYVRRYIPLRGKGQGAGLVQWLKNATPEQLRDRHAKAVRARLDKKLMSTGV